MVVNLVQGTNTKFKVDIADSETKLFEVLAEDLNIEPVNFAKSFRPISSSNLVGEPQAVIVDVVNMRNLGKVEVNYSFAISVETENGRFRDANFVSLMPVTMFTNGYIAEADLPIFIQKINVTGFTLKSPQHVAVGVTYRMDKTEFRVQTATDL